MMELSKNMKLFIISCYLVSNVLILVLKPSSDMASRRSLIALSKSKMTNDRVEQVMSAFSSRAFSASNPLRRFDVTFPRFVGICISTIYLRLGSKELTSSTYCTNEDWISSNHRVYCYCSSHILRCISAHFFHQICCLA